MQYQPQIEQRNGKDYIFCAWRRKYVRLTPEEWVRQHFLHALVEDFAYPQTLIAVEASISVGEVKKRCDAIIYDNALRPLCIVEFKAPAVSLTQRVFDQITAYNFLLHVDYLIVSNGMQHYCCRMDYEKGQYAFLKDIPPYSAL